MVVPGPEVTVCCGADVVDVDVAAELVAVDVGVFVGLDPQAARTSMTSKRTVLIIAFDSGTERNECIRGAGTFCR